MSTSRLEKFIYAICSMEVSDLPAPLSRIEILWNCLITGETPDFEPQSRNEQYLMAMLGLYELENLPTPMSRGEKLLYKIAIGETDLSDIPAYLSRYEELLGYLAENGGVGDFEYILQTLNQRLSTLYSTKERPMKQAVIKGDTLVNELPRPSLKNTMTNTASQKLNQGYDNGKTLVNLLRNDKIAFQKAPTDSWSSGLEDPNANRCSARMENIKPNTRYIVKSLSSETKQIYIRFWNSTSNIRNGNTGWININSIITTLADTNKISISFRISENNEVYTDISQCSNILLLEYQDGMENWDIPHFEGTKTFSATLNVVDGEFKQAVVKGQTLVNIKGEETFENDMVSTHHDFLIPSVKKNTDYLIKYDTTLSGGVLAIGFLKNNNTWSKNLEKQPNVGIIKLNSGDNPNYFRLIGIKDVTLSINNLMIIEYQEGMENWDIPYFEGMQSVQLSEVTTENVKNLINKQTMQCGYIEDNGLFKSNDNDLASDYIKITPNTYYTYQVSSNISSTMRFSFFDENKKIITRTTTLNASGGKYATYISPSNAYYVRTHSNNFKNIGFNPDLISLVVGEKPLSDVHQSNTLTLAEPVTLRKVGDVEDTFDALIGQVTERVGEMTFDGSADELWSVDTPLTNHYKFLTSLKNGYYIPDDIITSSIISDKYPSISNGDGNDVESICINGWVKDGRGNFNLSINKTKLSNGTVDELREYLSQNPITVQYELATPISKTINTTITDQNNQPQAKLHSFNDGYLSVSSQGLFPSAVNYEVPTNNSYYLPDMLTLGAQYTARGSVDCNATIDGKLLSLGKNRTFTAPSSLTNRLMVLDTPVDDLMFIKGDQTAKDFGYFEGMKSVALSNKMPVLTTTGKNLFDKTRIVKDCYIASTGNVVKQEGDERNATDFISVIPDTTYTLSGIKNSGVTSSNTKFYIAQYNSNKNVIKNQAFSVEDDKATLTVDSNTSYIRTTVRTQDLERFQIEYGTQATVYEPFKTNILTTSEDVVLRGIGDVKDTLDCLTGEVTQRIGEIVLDGSQNLSITQTGENTIRYQYVFNDKSYGLTNVVSDILPTITVFGNDTECISGVNNNSNILFRLSKEKATNVQECKQYLQQNPITVHYERITPTVKTVDLTTIDQDGQPTKLKTFNDITHVEIKVDNMIPSVDVEVATKISETLSTLGLDHHDISETQNKLDQTIEEQTENTDAAMIATTEIYEQTL